MEMVITTMVKLIMALSNSFQESIKRMSDLSHKIEETTLSRQKPVTAMVLATHGVSSVTKSSRTPEATPSKRQKAS